MAAPTIATSSVSLTAIPLSWTAPTGAAAGGTGLTISAYYLQVSNDGSTYTDVSNSITGTTYSYTVTDDTKDYYFRIAASNIYGFQTTFSPATTVTKASAVPDAPAVPTVALEGTNVAIAWTAPSANNAVITAYKVKIQRRVAGSLSDYIESTTYCDGSLATVIANLKCTIPMSAFLGTTYNLLRSDAILAKVSAINSRGESASSSPNAAGLLVQTVPDQMSTPTRVSTSTATRFDLSWTALVAPSTGGSDILSYFLEWDSGSTGTSWSQIVGYSPFSTATTYSVTGNSSGLTAGATYGFRVSAYNIFGWGTTSTVAYLKAYEKPSVIASVTTTVNSTTGNLQISWSAPSNNGDTITSYTVQVQKYGDSATWTTPSTCVGASADVLSQLTC